jgi:hypothetical protein
MENRRFSITTIIVAASFIFGLCLFSQQSFAQGITVTLTSPNGGEAWTAGTTHNITWTSSGITNVKLEFSANNGSSWNTITTSTSATVGSYEWTVPAVNSSQCLVKVSDVLNAITIDQSNAVFSILGMVEVTAPNGGESWLAGTPHTITWASSGITNVKLYYSVNGGATWMTIVTSIAASSWSYDWIVPGTPGTTCIVKISDASNDAVSDQSNAVFTISGALALTSPNGGESWAAGSTHNITWSSTGIILLKLEFSMNNGLTWDLITAAIDASTGSYSWTVPVWPSSEYLVRATNANNTTLKDVSNAVFTVTPSVTVISPNGGESWACGSTHDITWISYGILNVKLQYSADNGASWTTLISSTGAINKTYSWTVPSTPGSQYLVRVSDALNASVSDQSNAVFAISAVVTVIAPNGGEQWTAGTIQSITWSSTAVDTVKIEYSQDGIFWNTIISKTPSSGSYLWFIPASYNSPTGRIRITDIRNGLVTDMNDNFFTITNLPVVVTVGSPNGGEKLTVGSTQDIVWNSSKVTNVNIEYSVNNGTSWIVIIESTGAAQGKYTWTVPNANSTQCRVRVSDSSNAAVNDISNAVFTIYPVTVTLTSPNGGEQWIVGKTYPITWTRQNVTNLKLEYSTSGGSAWNIIAASVSASTGSYPWTIPDSISTACLVKATDTSNAAARDSSNAVFTIARPTVTVTSPNGGEVWLVGNQKTVTWTSTGIDSVKIEYSTNSGATWALIVSSAASAPGSCSWTVPSVNSPNCLVRVASRSGYAVSDVSNGEFSILSVSMTLTSPNGGESWAAGSSQNITWNSAGVATVKLEYTADGLTWTEIASNLNAATGSYSWSIPVINSTQCLVRLTNMAILSVVDQSDSVFTIVNPVVTLTSPNGGEQWAAKRTIPITWQAIGISLVKLECSLDNGGAWSLLADNIDAKALSFSWIIPVSLSTKCLIRITDKANAGRSDVSNAVFTIVSPPTLRITSPNGGENWRTAATQNITWVSERIDSLRIEYTMNGGQKWTTLSPSVTAVTGVYQWKLPVETSSQSLVRITDTSDTTFTDTSDAPFYILLNNLNAGFALDANLRTAGNQGLESIESVGGSMNLGFALYAKDWENARGFTVTFSWDSKKADFRASSSSTAITNDQLTMNGDTFTPAAETNILGTSFLGAGEVNLPGNYTKSFALTGGNPPAGNLNGFLYLGVFRTAATFASSDSLSIRANVKMADDKGVVKDLGLKFFTTQGVLFPPTGLTVSDVPNDQGHHLRLTWTASVSEREGIVTGYRIYRSRTSAFTSPLPLSMFSVLDSLIVYEQKYTILIDTVSVGKTEYIDPCVPKNGVPYYYWVQAVGKTGASKPVISLTPTVVEELAQKPLEFKLGEAFPNPFNPSATIEYFLPKDTPITLEIYNISGQKIATLDSGRKSAGKHTVVWDAHGLPSGVYFYTLRAEGYVRTGKALLMK